MSLEVVLTIAASLVIAFLLTHATRKRALARGLLDVPNERSSHVLPTPRGGGIATVLTSIAAFAALALLRALPMDLLIALGVGGAAVAIVGFIDDRHRLSAFMRLIVHFSAAIWALVWLGGVPPLQIGDQLISLGWAGHMLGGIAIVWTLNLFNFMDGIDGIAASEAVFIACAGTLAAVLSDASSVVPAAALPLAAACCGFLLWNWPPAKIFMGDVGSGYLGYAVAVLALFAAHESPVALFVWLIYGAIFFVDATVTLARRLARRERVHEAHRSHAYQRLARRWASHKRVTVAATMVNLLWLLPWGLLAATRPGFAGWALMIAVAPLLAVAFAVGAGRPESPSE